MPGLCPGTAFPAWLLWGAGSQESIGLHWRLPISRLETVAAPPGPPKALISVRAQRLHSPCLELSTHLTVPNSTVRDQVQGMVKLFVTRSGSSLPNATGILERPQKS